MSSMLHRLGICMTTDSIVQISFFYICKSTCSDIAALQARIAVDPRSAMQGKTQRSSITWDRHY